MMEKITIIIKQNLDVLGLGFPEDLFFEDGSLPEYGQDGTYLFFKDGEYIYIRKERGQLLQENRSSNVLEVAYYVISDVISDHALEQMVLKKKQGSKESQQVLMLKCERALFNKLDNPIKKRGLHEIQSIVESQKLQLLD